MTLMNTKGGGLTLLLPLDVDGVRRRNSIVATNRPHPSAGRVVSETCHRPAHDSGPSAVLQSNPRGCLLAETLKCVIKVLKLYF